MPQFLIQLILNSYKKTAFSYYKKFYVKSNSSFVNPNYYFYESAVIAFVLEVVLVFVEATVYTLFGLYSYIVFL